MNNEIISYIEMCRREGASLQQGMNFFGSRPHSVILMSRRANAPYRDRIEDDGETLIYEGHDVPRRAGGPDPKTVDQQSTAPGGSLTQNGRFARAVSEYESHTREPRVVRAYEKLLKGTWSYNGAFLLVGTWMEHDGKRDVFKFKLVPASEDHEAGAGTPEYEHRRLIPSSVKQAVWKRDKGRCVRCGATDGLHFDHDLPFSKGGASILAENIQLLCARHNLSKGAQIQ